MAARAALFLPGDFSVLATHPEATSQASQDGQTLQNLTFLDDLIYVGYGDSNADTGPIVIRSANPTTGAWSTPHLTFQTEEISHFRYIGGMLYATNYDPLGLPGVNPGGYAVGNSQHQWSQVDVVNPATHVFDMLQTSNGEMWLTGSILTQAAVWRSVDGGQTFAIERLDDPAPHNTFARYFGVAELNGSVYIQRVDYNATSLNESLRFDGQNWSVGPDLVPGDNGHMVRPSNFAGGLVYVDHDRIDRNLIFFDGVTAEYTLADPIWDYAISSDGLIVLRENGELLRTLDGTNWEQLGMAPLEARSLAVNDGIVYLGTTDSRILRSNFRFANVPEPGTVWILYFLVAWLGYRRGRRCPAII